MILAALILGAYFNIRPYWADENLDPYFPGRCD